MLCGPKMNYPILVLSGIPSVFNKYDLRNYHLCPLDYFLMVNQVSRFKIDWTLIQLGPWHCLPELSVLRAWFPAGWGSCAFEGRWGSNLFLISVILLLSKGALFCYPLLPRAATHQSATHCTDFSWLWTRTANPWSKINHSSL